MNFTTADGKTNVVVFVNEKRLFIDGLLNEITEVKSNSPTFSRFTFGDGIECKISRGVMTYSNKTLFLKENVSKTQDTWIMFTVYDGLEVGINNTKDYVKINNETEQVTCVYTSGIHSVYTSESGVLRISSNEDLRKSTWNNIKMDLKRTRV